MIPTLTTERLTLRPPQPEDLSAYAAYCASDRTKLGGGPFTFEQARGFLETMIASWAAHGSGRFIMTQNGEPIGHAGILHGDEPELTWFIWNAASEGQGYAFEAAQAVLNWCRAKGHPSLVSYIDPENARSIALAERLGAVLDPGAPRPNDDPCLVYRHPMQGGAT